MTIKKENWFIIITDIICNQYKVEKYLYYTKKEALKLFKEKYKNEYELENQ